MVRTTLNLDDDVAAQLAERARREGRSLSRVTNDAVRAGLAVLSRPVAATPYAAPVFDSGASRLDLTDVSAVLDELDRRG